MKKLIKFLPMAAIVFASTLAFATTQKMNDPNVYWDEGSQSWQDLTPYLPDNYDCDGAGEYCTAYKDAEEQISDERPGGFNPHI